MAKHPPPDHGGRLRRAAENSNIPLDEWIDLSTGINPKGWPIVELPSAIWQRLPEPNDGLEEAAANYYGTNDLLPVAGSQAAIQALPKLRAIGTIGLPDVGYAEHAFAWHQAGHHCIHLPGGDPGHRIDDCDVLVVINPNNPTGKLFPVEQLLEWRATLALRGGWLVVDEAFIDISPEQSLAHYCPLPGLIVLRSLGKFFGLAGIRSGFVLAEARLRAQLQKKLGPWSVSGPTRFVAKAALGDSHWQSEARRQLQAAGCRLQRLLSGFGFAGSGDHPLFKWIQTDKAALYFDQLTQHGILVRYFEHPKSLRFGLPSKEQHWKKLELALREITQQNQNQTREACNR